MKTRHHINVVYINILVILGILLSGCQSSSSASAGPTAAAPRPPAETAAPALAPTQTLAPSETAAPTATPIRSTATLAFTPTSARTPTPRFTATNLPTPTPAAAPFFDTFVKSLINGNKKQVVGVYVEKLMALKVVQQPANDPGFVSTVKETATYFAMVKNYLGNTGLLAHNYLAGIYYFDLQPGQSVVLIYGDGHTEEYVVSKSDRYQAVNPTSPTSNFINLASGETLTSTDLFNRVYGGTSKTTFQTCIAQGNESSWGRLFVIAPVK